VDAPSLTISTGSYTIGTLQSGNLLIGTPAVTVTIQTIGAGFTLSLSGSSTIQAGISQIAAWSGTTANGFGFDYTTSGSATSKSYSGSLTKIAPTVLDTIATGSYLGGNGNLRTYTYTIKYVAKINALQAAGVYNGNTNFNLQLQY